MAYGTPPPAPAAAAPPPCCCRSPPDPDLLLTVAARRVPPPDEAARYRARTARLDQATTTPARLPDVTITSADAAAPMAPAGPSPAKLDAPAARSREKCACFFW